MNNQSEDRPARKSARQRVPNAFYTQAINELKKAPKSYREPTGKIQSKKPRIYHESQVNSELQDDLQDDNSAQYDEKNWYPCRLPKTNKLLKVQFVLNNNQQSLSERRKEELVPKIVKKGAIDSNFDLLSLFQKAIENVNEEVNKPVQNEPQPKPLPAKPTKPTRPSRKQDAQGSITSVFCGSDKAVFLQSVLGQIQFQMKEHEAITEEVDKSLIEELREKLMSSQVLTQLQLFQSED